MSKKTFEKKDDNSNNIIEDSLLDEDAPFEDTRAIKYEDIVKNTPKEKMSKLPWLTGIILIFLVSIICGYMFLNGNPQTMFTVAVDRFFSSVSSNFSEDTYEISKGKISASFDIVSSNKLLSELGKIKIDSDYSSDNVNGLFKAKIKTKYENNKLLDFDLYSDKKNVYLYSKDVYSSYIKLDNNINLNIIKFSNLRNVLSGINQAIDKIATSEKINGKRSSYDLGEKSINIYEVSLEVNSKNYKRISNTFINTLKSNDEFTSSLSNILNKSEDEVTNYLEVYLTNLKRFFKENGTTTFKLYIDRKTNDFIRCDIVGKAFSFTYITDTSEFMYENGKDKVSGSIKLDRKKDKYYLNFDIYDSGALESKIKGNIIITNKKASSFGIVNLDKVKNVNDLDDAEKFVIYTKLFTGTKLGDILNLLK